MYVSLYCIYHYIVYIIILFISLYCLYHYIVYIIILYISLYCIYHYIVYIIILYTSLYCLYHYIVYISLYCLYHYIVLSRQRHKSILKVIYNIGTEILYFQCFVTTDMFLFSKSIIPEDSKISRRDLEHALWN